MSFEIVCWSIGIWLSCYHFFSLRGSKTSIRWLLRRRAKTNKISTNWKVRRSVGIETHSRTDSCFLGLSFLKTLRHLPFIHWLRRTILRGFTQQNTGDLTNSIKKTHYSPIWLVSTFPSLDLQTGGSGGDAHSTSSMNHLQRSTLLNYGTPFIPLNKQPQTCLSPLFWINHCSSRQ